MPKLCDAQIAPASISAFACKLVTPQVLSPNVMAQSSEEDRKSTRLNSSHGYISYAVFCLKKKSVVRNEGGGTFAVVGEMSVTTSREGRLGDFDEDGYLDLVIAGDNLQVLFGDGQGPFTPV